MDGLYGSCHFSFPYRTSKKQILVQQWFQMVAACLNRGISSSMLERGFGQPCKVVWHSSPTPTATRFQVKVGLRRTRNYSRVSPNRMVTFRVGWVKKETNTETFFGVGVDLIPKKQPRPSYGAPTRGEQPTCGLWQEEGI